MNYNGKASGNMAAIPLLMGARLERQRLNRLRRRYFIDSGVPRFLISGQLDWVTLALAQLFRAELSKVVTPNFEIRVLVEAGTGWRQENGFRPLIGSQLSPSINSLI